ncbi:hypothetical protein BC834DRAFT_834569 [Gloeopeniophorella convolvens]|nr:hypothetical protein BC834DRAFT_834569 [Gloeopeniophorella convolvens]
MHSPSFLSRCLSGDGCFPSTSKLAAFNHTIGGKLFAERPIGAACYPTDPVYNATTCATITQNYPIDQWRSDQFGDYEQINWETCTPSDACLVPPASNSSTCGQGSVPTYSVHATSSFDVTAYVKFATKHNLRIVVKNTGHDYAGRSSAKGGFALWTHGIQGITRSQAFVPAGCSIAPQDSVTIGAGVQWETVYKYADDNDILVIGGDSGQVGAAGGWIQGGGHSVLSPTYGLGVDNLLQATIVTADGAEHTISECALPDLFFAIRGGGAGNWGVVTSITYKAHPAVPVTYVSTAATFDNIDDNYKLLQAWIEQAPAWADLGGGAFLNVHLQNTTFLGIIPNGTAEQIQAALAPVEPFFPPNATTSIVSRNSFLPFFQETFAVANEIVGINFAPSSRLIPRHYFENDAAGLARAIRKGQELLGAQAQTQQIQILADTPAPAFKRDVTAVTPVWYSSLWHVIYTTAWPNDASVAQQRQLYSNVHQAAQVLRDYAPDGGAYGNEADVYEPDHEVAFWGAANAARLRVVKAKYDPQNFFTVWQGIGWDGAQDVKFQCYAPTNPGSASSVD